MVMLGKRAAALPGEPERRGADKGGVREGHFSNVHKLG